MGFTFYIFGIKQDQPVNLTQQSGRRDSIGQGTISVQIEDFCKQFVHNSYYLIDLITNSNPRLQQARTVKTDKYLSGLVIYTNLRPKFSRIRQLSL